MTTYQVWDGWIIGAIVLWAISSATVNAAGRPYAEAQKLAERLAAENRGAEPSAELRAFRLQTGAMWLQIASSLAVLLLLIDMIYKPGA